MPIPRSFSSEFGMGVTHLTPVKMQSLVDAWLSARMAAISAAQTSFFNANGRYWQGLVTHATSPAYKPLVDGEKPADELNRTPSDQPGATWAVQIPSLTGNFAAALTVDAYKSPAGHGWALLVEAVHNGVKYFRAIDPVAVTDSGWRVTQ